MVYLVEYSGWNHKQSMAGFSPESFRVIEFNSVRHWPDTLVFQGE